MLIPLSLSLFFLSFLWGYYFPRKSAWAMVVLYPFFSPMNLAIVPSSVLFLNIDRVAFAVSAGIHLRNWQWFNLKSLWKNKAIKIFLIFSLYVIVISLGDRLKNIVFTYIPRIYVSMILGYYLIRNERDYKRIIAIFAWQGGLFGLIILFQFFHVYDLPKTLREFLPNPSIDNYQINSYRYGLLRVGGSDGNSVNSGYRLSFYVFITFLYFNSGKSIIKKIPFVLAIAGLFLLITRAAYVGVISGFLYFFGVLIFTFPESFKRNIKYVLRIAIALIISFVILFNIPIVKEAIIVFAEYITSNQSNKSIEGKTARFDRAFAAIAEKPVLGHGSPEYAYYKVMDTDDLPAPLIFAIAGGISLLIIFLLVVFYMPYSFYRYIKIKLFNYKEKLSLLIISSAFVAGFVPLFSNWVMGHVTIMFMFYILMYRYYIKYLLPEKQKFLRKWE